MKKHNIFNKLNFLPVILSVVMWASCKTDKISPISEPVKDLTGTWKIIKATRNGTDLFGLVDSTVINFNKFNIDFKGSAYTLVNPLPFIVNQNGTYALDNPQLPFNINFKETGGAGSASTVFAYPIINGVRQLVLTFSPGCKQNIYIYSFIKVK